nr:conserved hypothetical protein [Hymenolepis microstoma]
MTCHPRTCDNYAKYAQNLYCNCKIYNDNHANLTPLDEETDSSAETEPFRIPRASPYPRAYPAESCYQIVNQKPTKEKCDDVKLAATSKDDLVAQYCPAEKKCVEVKRLPRFTTLPKYFQTDCNESTDGSENGECVLIWKKVETEPSKRSNRRSMKS